MKSRLNISSKRNNEKHKRLFVPNIFSSTLTFLMNVGISLLPWPTQRSIWASDKKTTNHSAHTSLLREGLYLHMRILTQTHAQWWISQSVHPHRWSLHFVIPLTVVHPKHADAVFINLLVICYFWKSGFTSLSQVQVRLPNGMNHFSLPPDLYSCPWPLQYARKQSVFTPILSQLSIPVVDCSHVLCGGMSLLAADKLFRFK